MKVQDGRPPPCQRTTVAPIAPPVRWRRCRDARPSVLRPGRAAHADHVRRLFVGAEAGARPIVGIVSPFFAPFELDA